MHLVFALSKTLRVVFSLLILYLYMAASARQQEEGWPLGLQPLNIRIGLGGGGGRRRRRRRSGDYLGGSMSFNTTTLITASPTSSTDFSSDLDTESTGSFFHDRSITLGSLIGVSSILEFSRRSIRGRRSEPLKVKKPCKTRPWIFSLCSRDSIEVKNTTHTTPSLGQFLAVERRASNNDQIRRNNQNTHAFVPDEISLAQPVSESNSLFVNGLVAPPQSSSSSGVQNGQSKGMEEGNSNGYGVPVLFSCMCGHDSH